MEALLTKYETSVDVLDGCELNAMCASIASQILGSTAGDDDPFDRKLQRFAFEAIEEAKQNEARRGKAGAHCFYCGTDVALICGCEFATAFGCGLPGRFVCYECHGAHAQIGKHLRDMFSFPRVWRSNSRKLTAERELMDAAREVVGSDRNAYDFDARDLRFFLAQASALDHEPDVFRFKVLNSFERSRFLDFQSLAAALSRAKDQTLLRALTRTLGRFRSDQFYR